MLNLDADHGGDAAFDLAVVNKRGILQDDAGIFQAADALGDGGHGKANLFCNCRSGHAGIFLEHGNDFEIGTIHWAFYLQE